MNSKASNSDDRSSDGEGADDASRSPHLNPNEVHHGHSLETGMLVRVREWTDVAPWVRLARTMRAAASPPLVLVSALVFLIWWPGVAYLAADLDSWSLDQVRQLSWWRCVGLFGWSVLLWAPAAVLMARQGALLTAGRTMIGLQPALAHSIKRTPAALLAAIVPWACALAIGMLILLVGWIGRLAPSVFVVEALLATICAAIAIPCGVLAFGSCVAIPISWAALANERDADALDSLSRGYEALFRRPLRVVFYTAIATVILGVAAIVSFGVARAAASVSFLMLAASGCSENIAIMSERILLCFPVVVLLTLMWSLLGGVYLLLRYDTGGQEVEDLWQPSLPSDPPLPKTG